MSSLATKAGFARKTVVTSVFCACQALIPYSPGAAAAILSSGDLTLEAGSSSISVLGAAGVLTIGSNATVTDMLSGNGVAVGGWAFTGVASLAELRNDGNIYGLTSTSGVGVLMLPSGVPGAASSIGTLTNNGTISASIGILLIMPNSNITLLQNEVGGVIAGYESGAAISAYSGSSVGMLVNDGAIVGHGATTSGIAIHGGSIGAGGIVNSGTISGGATGITVGAAPAPIGGITNSGTISGGAGGSLLLQNGVNAFTVTNTGRLIGNVNLGINRLTLDGDHASIEGSVIGGAGSVVNVNGAFSMMGAFTGIGSLNINNEGRLSLWNNVSAATTRNYGILSAAHGTRTITGIFIGASQGALLVDVSSNGSYGRLAIDGLAVLPANAMINVNVARPDFVFNVSTMDDIFSASRLISKGTFSVTDNSALFDFKAIKDGNTVDLAIIPNTSRISDAVSEAGNISDGNAAAVFDGLVDDFIQGGGTTGNVGMDGVISRLAAMSTQQEISDAVSQTQPILRGGMNMALSGAQQGADQVIQGRIEGEAPSAFDGNNFAWLTPSSLRAFQGGGQEGSGSVWVKPYGSWLEQGGGAGGYKMNTRGIVLGADASMASQSRIGVAFAYSDSALGNSSTLTPERADIQTYRVALYGRSALDARIETGFQADLGASNINGERVISFAPAVARSDYKSLSAHIGARIGQTYRMGESGAFMPSVRADYTYIRSNAYTETGAGALNLDVGEQNTEFMVLSVDGKFRQRIGDTVTLTANMGVGYNLIAKPTTIVSSFVGGGADMVTHGIAPARWTGHAGVGIEAALKNGREVSARYEAEKREGFTNQVVSIRMSWSF